MEEIMFGFLKKTSALHSSHHELYFPEVHAALTHFIEDKLYFAEFVTTKWTIYTANISLFFNEDWDILKGVAGHVAKSHS